MGFPDGSEGKESAYNGRRCWFNPWVGKIPWRRKMAIQSNPEFLPKKSCGQKSLAGCSLKGRKELDTTERLSRHGVNQSLTSREVQFISVQFSRSIRSNSLRPHGLRTPGFPIYYQLPEPTQTHVHHISDVIQPSHPLSSRKSQMCGGRRCELSLPFLLLPIPGTEFLCL